MMWHPAVRRSVSRLLLTLVLSVLSGAGCATPAESPGLEATATPAPSPTPTPTIEPTAAPSIEAPSIALPPDAGLAVEGGDPVIGELGSFTWDNTGSDSPWLPGTPMHIGRGEILFMALSGPVRLMNWTVGRTPGNTPGVGIEGVADGMTGVVRFPAPPAGTWSVNVDVWFADGLGSASYYWLIQVD